MPNQITIDVSEYPPPLSCNKLSKYLSVASRLNTLSILNNVRGLKGIFRSCFFLPLKFCRLSVRPFLLKLNWSKRPTTVPASSDHYFHTECPSVRPKTSKSSDNHCRPGLWAGRVDHWWLLFCIFCVLSLLELKRNFPIPVLNKSTKETWKRLVTI